MSNNNTKAYPRIIYSLMNIFKYLHLGMAIFFYMLIKVY